VKVGEVVEVHLDGLPLSPYVLTREDIVWQDKYLLAVAKPAGVESQPTPARYRGTLYEALLNYLQNPFRPMERAELGMVQRLDRETSGVMVFSIHPRAHRRLTQIISGREAEKTYQALVSGILTEKQGEIRSMLARNRATNRVRSVLKGGKEAITRYRVLSEFANASLVEVNILTGRSHQIRAHFSEAGHPLLGDERYGGPRFLDGRKILRQMLHALRIALPHPVTGELLTLEAPLPEDMSELLREMARSDRPEV
jgi:23S rRNA pseudouridine1911/1915/1917 synthase